MGQDREELKKLMLGSVFAIHTNHWRVEIDFWKSSIDFDVAFLGRLGKKWLEW